MSSDSSPEDVKKLPGALDRAALKTKHIPESPDTDCGNVRSYGLTLEQVVEMTGEFEHLNQLVLLRLERSGGFTGTDAYFKTVQPVLDLLEIEIRLKCWQEMPRQQMKLIIQDWIDREIKEMEEQ